MKGQRSWGDGPPRPPACTCRTHTALRIDRLDHHLPRRPPVQCTWTALARNEPAPWPSSATYLRSDKIRHGPAWRIRPLYVFSTLHSPSLLLGQKHDKMLRTDSTRFNEQVPCVWASDTWLTSRLKLSRSRAERKPRLLLQDNWTNATSPS
jgi:hypothetical protein